MGRPYALDLRERVVAAMAAGMSGQQAAYHFSIGESSALRWARRARETGSPKAKPMGGKRPFALEAHRHWIIVRFLAWVTQFLVPTLRPGDVVIMDNLSSHKRRAIRTAIRTAGALLLFLPAYSPDLNPIEQVFAKIKALLRKADARSIDEVDAALGALIDEFGPDECARYLSAAGYQSISG